MMQHYVVGLDLGQVKDPSALAVLKRQRIADPLRPTEPNKPAKMVSAYDVVALKRWPLGTSYPAIVDAMQAMMAKPPLAGSLLAVDGTGVGKAVIDSLVAAKINARVHEIQITSGQTPPPAQVGRAWHVPKKELVSVMQVLLQGRRLAFAALPLTEVLVKELKNFRVKITPAANEVYEAWREGQHDDLVLAAAMAAWLGERLTPAPPRENGRRWVIHAPCVRSPSARAAWPLA